MTKIKPIVYEIQTTNKCNGQCIVCPHKSVEQSYQTMDICLFEKIIDEIAVQREVVRIVLYLNGEPFLDEYFAKRIRYVRLRCPLAVIEVSTNLSVIREDIFEAIREYDIDDFRISCFGFSKDTYEKVMPGLSYETFCENIMYIVNFREKFHKLKHVSLTMLDIPELQEWELRQAKIFCDNHQIELNFWGYLDRAGNVQLRSNSVLVTDEEEKNKLYTCAQRRHIERMHILFDGAVILCCQDWHRKYVFGSVKTNTIKEIWESKDYEMIRAHIDQKGYPYPSICKRCKILLEGKKNDCFI